MKKILASSAFLLVAAALSGQANTTSGTAANYFWGQTATSGVSGTTSQFWFVLSAVHNRSYCVEVGNFAGAYGDKVVDPALSVYPIGSTIPMVTNDESAEEPLAALLPRACFVYPLPDNLVYVRVSPNGTTPGGIVTVRFLETTMFCNWFFVAGDYNAFSLIRNTSSTALTGALVVWRGLSGAIAGSTVVSVPANGAVILNARDFVSPAVFSNGTIEISHPGAFKQLQATTTTLSLATGLSFDASFESRPSW